jgi:curved DNA-binding protein CbpA
MLSRPLHLQTLARTRQHVQHYNSTPCSHKWARSTNITPKPRHSQHRPFATTPKLQAHQHEPTHYELLGVDPSIAPTDLKKRFYTLSREHHPDLHPTDPTAVQRFQRISESYSILSNAEKRAKYDREVLPRLHSIRNDANSSAQRSGTYAGSRAPTGLSKRRSAFKGPPPSYFRHGNNSTFEAEQARRQRDASQSSSSSNPNPEDHEYNASHYPGAFHPESSAPIDFDARPVYKTQTAEDARRNARRAAAMAEAQMAAEERSDFAARFVMVSCVLVGGLTISGLLTNMFRKEHGGRAGGMVRADGSKRERS